VVRFSGGISSEVTDTALFENDPGTVWPARDALFTVDALTPGSTVQLES
jgi:hypothetical protein